MKSILFFHPKNDYTGSTRVLADVMRGNLLISLLTGIMAKDS